MQPLRLTSALLIGCLGFGLTHVPTSSFGQQSDFLLSTNAGAITIVRYVGAGGLVRIPSQVGDHAVTAIGESAFESTLGVTSVAIPNTVVSIGDYAFFNCSGMTNLALDNGVITIGSWAFELCVGLGRVDIPSSVRNIGHMAFYSCTGLTNAAVPNTVTNLGSLVFGFCSGLVTASVGNGIGAVPESAFEECANLASVTISDGITNIGPRAFFSCTSLTNVVLPASATTIGAWAFELCTSLKEVQFLGSVQDIGQMAFYLCTGLTEITIPDTVTNLGSSAFGFCSGLVSANIGHGIRAVPESAFEQCTNLASVVISDGVTGIGAEAFFSCISLTNVVMPLSATTIGAWAFELCTSLRRMEIPASVTNIANMVFYGCSNLNQVLFAGEAPQVGEDVFTYAVNAVVYYRLGAAGWGATFADRPTKLWFPGPATCYASISPAGEWTERWNDYYDCWEMGDGATWGVTGLSLISSYADSGGEWDWIREFAGVSLWLTNSSDSPWYSRTHPYSGFDLALPVLTVKLRELPPTPSDPEATPVQMEISAHSGNLVFLATYTGAPTLTNVPETIDSMPYTLASGPLEAIHIAVGDLTRARDSILKIAVLPQAAALQLSWNSVTNRLYQVQSCGDLCEKNWADEGSPRQGIGLVISIREALGSNNGPRFFRLLEFP